MSIEIIGALIMGIILGQLLPVARVRRTNSIEYEQKIDQILNHLNIVYDPSTGVPEEIVNEIREGNKASAIKLYRSHYLVGLKEAGKAVSVLSRSLQE